MNKHKHKSTILIKVISGGQTGTDRAGLKAAKECGIETGGWMPKGFKAHDGNHPEFAKIYNILEHTESTYPPRTAMNIKESDGTIQIATNFNSPGEILTSKMIRQYNKPSMAINIEYNITTAEDIIRWIIDNKIKVLNVAGNSERTSPGIEKKAEILLYQAFKIAGEGFEPTTSTL